MWATVQGIETWDDRLDDPSADGRAALMALVERWAAQIDELSRLELSVEDTVTLGLMRAVVRRFRGAHELRLWQFDALDQINGPQSLVGELARFQRTDTPRALREPARAIGGLSRLDGGAPRQHRARAWLRGAPLRLRWSSVASTQTRELLETPAEASPLMIANAGLPTSSERPCLRPSASMCSRPWPTGCAMLERLRRPRARRRRRLPPAGWRGRLPPRHPQLHQPRRRPAGHPRLRPAAPR